jgi:hypothetical protein
MNVFFHALLNNLTDSGIVERIKYLGNFFTVNTWSVIDNPTREQAIEVFDDHI